LRAFTHALPLIALLAAAPEAWARKADVIAVEVTAEGAGVYSFDVTVKSDETGWDKYADRWEVVAPDGAVLGTRVLQHPHVEEQPFTRRLSGVAVPDGATKVKVRAHDKVEGFGGAEMTVDLPR
jgi:hypothetical protein